MDIVSILWALVSLCIAVAVIYLILWVLGRLGIVLPEKIKRIIWVILVLLVIIWIINNFFAGGSGIRIHHRRWTGQSEIGKPKAFSFSVVNNLTTFSFLYLCPNFYIVAYYLTLFSLWQKSGVEKTVLKKKLLLKRLLNYSWKKGLGPPLCATWRVM